MKEITKWAILLFFIPFYACHPNKTGYSLEDVLAYAGDNRPELELDSLLTLSRRTYDLRDSLYSNRGTGI